mmetsp:Transcript_48564/g.145029  ORF Transcript_48564/g.145029 Transcript_48564/m.145029 type:complete len:187 (+) Transcript_48564:2-562(+)
MRLKASQLPRTSHSARRPLSLLALLAACAALAGVAGTAYVATPPLAARRRAALALAGAALLPEAAAVAGDRDRAAELYGVRRLTMPVILRGYRGLQAQGEISDEFLQKDLKKMVRAMEAYGSINRVSDAPDKVSRKLQKDANKFAEAAKKKDYPKAMELLETYRQDVPAGIGQFTWDSKLEIDRET